MYGGTLDIDGNNLTIGELDMYGGTITSSGNSSTPAVLSLNGASYSTCTAEYGGCGICDGPNQKLAVTLENGANVYFLLTETYTGDTTINSGSSLRLGGGGGDGNLSGSNIVDNGALYFNVATTVTYAQIIRGSGDVHVNGYWGSGARTVILTNAETFTGTTYVDYGTLQLGNGTTNGSVQNSNSIVDNAILRYLESGNFTPAMNTTGSGSVVDADATGTLDYTSEHSGFTGSDSNTGGGTLLW